MSDSVKYYYLKLKDNFFDRPEIKAIEALENGYEYICIMQKMYLKSLCRNGKLMITDKIPYEIDILSKVLNHNIDIVRTAIKIFQEFGLIEILSDKTIYMTEIQNFIGESSTEADRIRQYRNKIENERCTKVVQMFDKSTPEIEIKLEIEKEIEIDKGKISKENDTTIQPEIKNKKFEEPCIDILLIEIENFLKDYPKYKVCFINLDESNISCSGPVVNLANTFNDYYSANGWHVGKNKMKSWEAALRGWITRAYNKNEKFR